MAIRKNGRRDGAKKGADQAAPKRGRRLLLFFLMLAVVLGFACGIIWLVIQIPGTLTSRNPRFQLRRIEVKR